MTPVVIWDWNGTLLDDVQACVAAINDLLQSRRLPAISVPEHVAAFTFPVRTYYQRIGFDLDSEPFSDVAVEYHAAYDHHARHAGLRMDAISALEAVAAAGLRQYVLSASEEQRLNQQLRHHSVAPFLAASAGLGNLEATSKVERGRQLLAQEQIDPQTVWLIGDTVHDHDVARLLGCNSILVTGGHQTAPALRATQSPVVGSLTTAVATVWDAHTEECRPCK
jgi:phosphoglycolate phosphatase